MSFRKGQKIVCVNDIFPNWKEAIQRRLVIVPKKDFIYTIREIIENTLLLNEIINEKRKWKDGTFNEPLFMFHHFRPLQNDEEIIEEEQEELADIKTN